MTTLDESQPAPAKKKRTLPAALAKFKFQKGHKRATKPASAPAAPGAVTVRRVGLLEWMGIR